MKEIQVDRKALRKVSNEFRGAASRLLNGGFQDSDANLQRFIAYIEKNSIIYGFLEQEMGKVDVSSYPPVQKVDDSRWNVPTDPSAEVVYVYSLLRGSVRGESGYDYLNLSMYYHPNSSKFQDHVDVFNRSVVLPFINHIEQYLQGLMIDAGIHDRDSTSVNVSSGGMYVGGNAQGSILAAGTASVSESTATYTDTESLVKGVGKLREYMDDVPEHKRREAGEALDVLVASASGETVPKTVLAEKVELLGNNSSRMKEHLIALTLNASGGVASHLIIQAINYVF